MAGLGDTLQSAREARGLTLQDVEQKTHIRQHLLQALEENRFEAFPSPVIARGLIRNYAKFLDLDPLECLKQYDGKGHVPIKGQRLTADGIEFLDLSMASRSYINWELIIGISLGFLVVAGLWYLASGTVLQSPTITATPSLTPRTAGISEDSALLLPTATPPPTETPTPLPPTGTPTPVIYSGVTVELNIQQSSWVQILADDEKVFEGILQPGDTPNWTGERRVAIRAGNGGGVEVIVNGVNRGLMGEEGQVVDQIWEKVEDPAERATAPTAPPPQFSDPPTDTPATTEPAAPEEIAPEPTSEG